MGLGVSNIYNHEQETAELKWTVNHNLNTLAPCVDVWVTIDGKKQKILPYNVNVIDANTCEVEFTSARVGTAAVR